MVRRSGICKGDLDRQKDKGCSRDERSKDEMLARDAAASFISMAKRRSLYVGAWGGRWGCTSVWGLSFQNGKHSLTCTLTHVALSRGAPKLWTHSGVGSGAESGEFLFSAQRLGKRR